MRVEDLNLAELRGPLEKALVAYEKLHDDKIKFQDFSDFKLTPEKPNSARTVIPVNYSNTHVGDMYAIVFLPLDGTGDTSTYNLDEIGIPPFFKYPERVIPRAKTGIICEGCFPLFSVNRQNYVAMFAASLEEITVREGDPQTIIPAWGLGQNAHEFSQAINSGLEITPKVHFTTGTDKNSNRFGDPHSVYYGIAEWDAIQVVGFLGVKDTESPLLELTDRWILPPGYD